MIRVTRNKRQRSQGIQESRKKESKMVTEKQVMHRSDFFDYVYKTRCKFSEDREEVGFIGDGVKSIVYDILQEIGTTIPLFKVSKVIPTGSYYEKAKVGSPDEFDFMIVLENLSQPGSVELTSGCTPWYPKVKIVNNMSIYSKYLERSTEYLGEPSKMVYDFWKTLHSLLQAKSFSAKTPKGTITTCLPSKLQHKLELQYKENFNPPEDKSPGLVHIKTINIGVDLMLAIEHPNIGSVLSNSQFPFKFKQHLLQSGCHVVAKSCHKKHFPDPACWFITFAALELETMKNIDQKHKEGYMVLKSLLIGEINYPGKCMNLSSYMLKTALMFHVYGDTPDGKCSNPRHYDSCILDILKYLKNGFFSIHMPCFFARDLNTWGCLLEVPCFNWHFELNDEEKRIGELEMYALLWLKMWHMAIDASENLLTDDSCSKKRNFQSKILPRFDRFKASVRVLLEKYYSSGEVFKGQVKIDRSRVDNLNELICARFPEYMENLKKYYDISENVI